MIHQLDCKNCGAKLDIGDDTDIFSCGYCGSQQQVDRTGGIVQLRKLENTINAIRSGTDRTAAELALVRLEKELAAAQQERDSFKSAYSPSTEGLLFKKPSVATAIFFGVLFFIATSFLLSEATPRAPIYAMLTGLVVAIGGHRCAIRGEKYRVRQDTEKYNLEFENYSRELQKFEEACERINSQISQQRKIADQF